MSSVHDLMDLAYRQGIAQERSHGHGGALSACGDSARGDENTRKSGSVAGELFLLKKSILYQELSCLS